MDGVPVYLVGGWRLHSLSGFWCRGGTSLLADGPTTGVRGGVALTGQSGRGNK